MDSNPTLEELVAEMVATDKEAQKGLSQVQRVHVVERASELDSAAIVSPFWRPWDGWQCDQQSFGS